jgi:hypothetical protein
VATSFNDLTIVSERYGAYSSSDERAWALGDCANCGGTQMAVVAISKDGKQRWLRCANCSLALVENEQILSPSVKPLRIPVGVVGVELTAWNEVRECLGAGATTAAVMMCRKLLLHIAVSHGLPAKNEKDRSPSFMEAVQHLEDEGLITKHMRPWVDRIKDVGNEATHEITPVTPEIALDVARFMLRLTFEMEALMTGQEVPRQRPE